MCPGLSDSQQSQAVTPGCRTLLLFLWFFYSFIELSTSTFLNNLLTIRKQHLIRFLKFHPFTTDWLFIFFRIN
jgi:hypothetical protein